MEKISKLWSNENFRNIFFQVLVFAGVFYVLFFFYENVSEHLNKSKIASGFGYLEHEASFDISESLIEYSHSDSYARLYVAGALNTIFVAVIGIFFSIIVGVVVGVLRLSKNWLLDKLAYIYTELVRNTPLLLLLFYCYSVLTEFLPTPKEAISIIPGFFLSNRGLAFPEMNDHFVWNTLPLMVLLGFFVAIFARRKFLKIQELTGKYYPSGYLFILLPILFPFLIWAFGGAPTEYTIPKLSRFNFEGGNFVSPEFMALATGLIVMF